MEPGRPLVGAASGTTPPKGVFGDFLRIQKVTRRRLWNGLIGQRGPLALARLSKDMGSETSPSVMLRMTAPPPGGSHVLKDAVLELKIGKGHPPLN